MKRNFFIILYFVSLATIVNSVVYYIGPTHLLKDTECDKKVLTLSQFVSNASNYLTDDTSLSFAPGYYSLEFELIVENIHSFSMYMFVDPIHSLSKSVITCGHRARFEFRNVSSVTVSGLDFVGCFQSHVVSVSFIQLENSAFYCCCHAELYGTTVIIEDSTANLDRVNFTSDSAVENARHNDVPSDSSQNCTVKRIISSMRSTIVVSQSWFEGHDIEHGRIIYSEGGSHIAIFDTMFVNNRVEVILESRNSTVSICQSEFFGNNNYYAISILDNGTISVDHSKFRNNTGTIILSVNTYTISISHSQFVDNIASSLIGLDGTVMSISHNEFSNNNVSGAIVVTRYYTTLENLTNNMFTNNCARFEIYITTYCRPGLSFSLGTSQCIECSDHWFHTLIGIVVFAFIAGVALVILLLTLNMTVAVGTLNGILFYANIIVINGDTYLPFTSPTFVTVFISWLNLDIGFDVCFSEENDLTAIISRPLIKLAFPAYLIALVIIVIIAGEKSSKFAKLIGKGNPVAVLTTMISLSYGKLLNTILGSISMLYNLPAYGSRNLDSSRNYNVFDVLQQSTANVGRDLAYVLVIVSMTIFLFVFLFTILIFSWQWLLYHQDKTIFKWVRYHKLRYFLEPYYAPYTANHRYWTGLLLLVRILLSLILHLNFSLDPRVNLMSTALVVGGLILLKGVIANRVYRSWPLDVMETTVYFNLVAFSALTWYNLDFGGNQEAVAYTSVMTIFILLLGVILFHVLRYTRLHKCLFVEKTFKWVSLKLTEEKTKQEPRNDAPEELDGYQLERTIPGDQEISTVTHSVIEICQPVSNEDEI